jgi:hypothetical protein
MGSSILLITFEHNYSESFSKTNPIFEAICCEKCQFQEKCEYDPNKDEDFQRLMNDTSRVVKNEKS